MKIYKVENKREVVDTEYKICKNKYCCKKMKHWLKVDGHGYNHTLYFDLKSKKFRVTVDVDNMSNYSMYANEATRISEEMNYCPFCGEQLQYVEKSGDVI